MLDWLVSLLSGKSLVKFGYSCWNGLSGCAMGLLGSTPAELADGSLWQISIALVTVMKIVGASLFNMLFYVNFCKHSADLKDHQTLEMVMTLLIRLVLGNFLILQFDNIVNGMSQIMQALFEVVAPGGAVSVALQEDVVDDWFWYWEADSMMLSLILSVVFLLVAIGAGLLLVLHVYGIFLKVFFYIIIGPLALAAVSGPEHAASSAEHWFKTFLCAFAEFSGAALMLRLCAVMINSNSFLIAVPDSLLVYESLWNIGQSMLVILLSVSGVKLVDSMIRRSLGF